MIVDDDSDDEDDDLDEKKVTVPLTVTLVVIFGELTLPSPWSPSLVSSLYLYQVSLTVMLGVIFGESNLPSPSVLDRHPGRHLW